MPKVKSDLNLKIKKSLAIKTDKSHHSNDLKTSFDSDDDDDESVRIVIDSSGETYNEFDFETVSIRGIHGDDDLKKPELKQAPAWVDDDDIFTCQEVIDIQGRKCKLGTSSGNDYKQSLEERYANIMGVPKWAKRKKKQNLNSVLVNTGSLIDKSTALAKGTIELQKLSDINCETHAEGPILKSVLFHPKATVALVAGLSGVASIFQVDGGENPKLHTAQFKRFPISCASFLRDGEEYIVGSKFHKYFYSHDLISGQCQQVCSSGITDITNVKNFKVTPDGKHIAVYGKFGNIYLLSATTKEYVCTLRMNGELSALGFYGNKMYSHGTDGEVYIWDLNTRDCIHKFVDDGCLHGTAIAAAPNGRLLATGSSSGVVNVYNTEDLLLKRNPCPTKILYNLVTGINSLEFNATSELLCFASDFKENAIKLLHTSSMSVFSNFPSFQARFNRVQCVNFSPNSGYLTFGDNKQFAHLFRLKHFGNY